MAFYILIYSLLCLSHLYVKVLLDLHTFFNKSLLFRLLWVKSCRSFQMPLSLALKMCAPRWV